MAVYKVAITKSTQFKGKDEEFSNVYTYKSSALNPEGALETLADNLVAIERALFPGVVFFRKVQVWDAGTPPNYMHVSKTLTGTGSNTPTGSVYKECAVMISWPLPRRQGLRRTIRRDLRKFLHTYSTHGWLDATGANTTPASPPSGNAVRVYAEALPTVAGYDFCAPNGDVPTGPPNYHGWLEHRQFPRGRKRTGSS